MFGLDNAPAKIANVNPRAEKHGEDNKLAADIKIELQAHNSILDSFDEKLRKALFRKPGKGEQQDMLDKDQLTAVQFPRVEGVSWQEEFPGYDLQISEGMGLAEPLFVSDVMLKKFRFEPLEGGSVNITFNVICHPDADEIGQLCTLIQSDVAITLTPPAKQSEALPKAA
jgi:hypothetical protein